MIYRSDMPDPQHDMIVLAGLEFTMWLNPADAAGMTLFRRDPDYPIRTVWRDPARPLEPDSMEEMLGYCAMAWRAV